MALKDLLHPVLVRELVQGWLREDTSSFDYGGCIVGEQITEAVIFCKEQAVLAGVPFANAIVQELRCTAKWQIDEGSWIETVAAVARVSGPACNLLLAERIILNCLSRASGVATATRKMKSILDEIPWQGELAGTRKTTPGFRMVEKYALLVGGASTHRYDLSGMIMLKDNHVKICGSISKAVAFSKKIGGFTQKIEVECRSEMEALEAADSGADIVMLDNFHPEKLQKVAKTLKRQYPKLLIEASGRIKSENIIDYAVQSVDVISTSAIVQGYPTIDFSMKV